MRKKFVIAVISIIILIFGFIVYNERFSKIQMIGILKEHISNPKIEFLGTYSKNKENSKFAGYITGENLDLKDILITEDFKENTINIFNLEVKYPNFFKNFSPVEVSDGAIQLISTSPNENRLYKNSFTIVTKKIDKGYSLENFKDHYSSPYSKGIKLENYKVEGKKLMMNFNVDYESIGHTDYSNIKEYIHAELKDDTIYYVQYRYDNPKIGSKVIDLINSSFKIV